MKIVQMEELAFIFIREMAVMFIRELDVMFIGATLQISTYPQLLPDYPADGMQIEKLLDFAIFPKYLLVSAFKSSWESEKLESKALSLQLRQTFPKTDYKAVDALHRLSRFQ